MKIVDFFVKSDYGSVGIIPHGLMSYRRQVDDGQATMGKTDTAFFKQELSLVIRSTMRDEPDHGAE